jgi:hypothetical protein
VQARRGHGAHRIAQAHEQGLLALVDLEQGEVGQDQQEQGADARGDDGGVEAVHRAAPSLAVTV